MNLTRDLTYNNRYVACETFTLHQATDLIDDDRSGEGFTRIDWVSCLIKC